MIHEGVTKIITIGLGISKYPYFQNNNLTYTSLYNNEFNGKYNDIINL